MNAVLRGAALTLGVVWLAEAASAQSVKLKASEITALLSGNTAVGDLGGASYRQYFDPKGVTVYVQDGTQPRQGEWRVDILRDEFKSIWPRDTRWEGWFVMVYQGDYFWVSKSTPPTLFKVLDGKQLAPVTE